MTMNDETRNAIIRRCTGPNVRCRAAHREGSSIHITPVADAKLIVLPTYHYKTQDEAHNALAEAIKNAPLVMSDDDFYNFRSQGIAFKLPDNWVDPSQR